MSDLRQIPFYIGTMGFSYNDWNGPFYPKGMTSQRYLEYYSRIFNTVEIDSTFYGTPRSSTIKRWSSATPSEFLFSLKTPKIITHGSSLKDTSGLMYDFLETVKYLDCRLGVILLQFPPSFTIERQEELLEFLSTLPKNFNFAVEVRHPSWYSSKADFEGGLKSLRIGWAATQYPGLPENLHLSADFLYIRWIGQHGSFEHHHQERIDRGKDMLRWQNNLVLTGGLNTKVFGYFNNDYAGFAAGSALKFKELIGESSADSQQPTQKSLF